LHRRENLIEKRRPTRKGTVTTGRPGGITDRGQKSWAEKTRDRTLGSRNIAAGSKASGELDGNGAGHVGSVQVAAEGRGGTG